ncbi:hypothetical protein [Bacillus thuringiensis]|uniref:hypothetical protein n=1 Tax=Bacillus thuringiensis TaxID=1428 RepID=UPI002175A568|nr:hypothetical protein [Bacillus thuringiensis]
MMHWPRLFMAARHAAPVEIPADIASTDPIDLSKFESFKPAEVQALPRRLRREVIAYRKARVTAALERFVAAR